MKSEDSATFFSNLDSMAFKLNVLIDDQMFISKTLSAFSKECRIFNNPLQHWEYLGSRLLVQEIGNKSKQEGKHSCGIQDSKQYKWKTEQTERKKKIHDDGREEEQKMFYLWQTKTLKTCAFWSRKNSAQFTQRQIMLFVFKTDIMVKCQKSIITSLYEKQNKICCWLLTVIRKLRWRNTRLFSSQTCRNFWGFLKMQWGMLSVPDCCRNLISVT